MIARPLALGARTQLGPALYWNGSKQLDLLIGLRTGECTAILGPRQGGRSSLVQDAVIAQVRTGSRVVIAAAGHEVLQVPEGRGRMEEAGVSRGITWVTGDARTMSRRTVLGALLLAEPWAEAGEQVLLVIDGVPRSSWFLAADRVGSIPARGSLSVLVVPEGPVPFDPPVQQYVVLDGGTDRINLKKSGAYGWVPARRLLGEDRLALPLAQAEHLDECGIPDSDPQVAEKRARAARLWRALEQPPGFPVPLEEQLVRSLAVLFDFRGDAMAQVLRADPGLLPAIRTQVRITANLRARLVAAFRMR